MTDKEINEAVAWDIINHHQGHFTIWKTRDGEWACLMDTPDELMPDRA